MNHSKVSSMLALTDVTPVFVKLSALTDGTFNSYDGYSAAKQFCELSADIYDCSCALNGKFEPVLHQPIRRSESYFWRILFSNSTSLAVLRKQLRSVQVFTIAGQQFEFLKLERRPSVHKWLRPFADVKLDTPEAISEPLTLISPAIFQSFGTTLQRPTPFSIFERFDLDSEPNGDLVIDILQNYTLLHATSLDVAHLKYPENFPYYGVSLLGQLRLSFVDPKYAAVYSVAEWRAVTNQIAQLWQLLPQIGCGVNIKGFGQCVSA